MEIRWRGPSAPIFEWKTRARMEQSSREHFAMVEALKGRQLARLQKLIRAHIRQTEAAGSDAVAPLRGGRAETRAMPGLAPMKSYGLRCRTFERGVHVVDSQSDRAVSLRCRQRRAL